MVCRIEVNIQSVKYTVKCLEHLELDFSTLQAQVGSEQVTS